MPFAPATRIPKRNRWISRPILGVSFTAVDRGWAHIENALNLVADHPQLCVYTYIPENTLSRTTETFTSFFVRCDVVPRRQQFVSKTTNVLSFKNRTEIVSEFALKYGTKTRANSSKLLVTVCDPTEWSKSSHDLVNLQLIIARTTRNYSTCSAFGRNFLFDSSYFRHRWRFFGCPYGVRKQLCSGNKTRQSPLDFLFIHRKYGSRFIRDR